MAKKRILLKAAAVLVTAVSVALTALPNGVRMTFAAEAGAYRDSFCSYWNLMPWGYGNMLPLLTAALSAAAVCLLVAGFRFRICSVAAAVFSALIFFSVLSWCYFGTFTVTGLCIALLHLLALGGSLADNAVYERKIKKPLG